MKEKIVKLKGSALSKRIAHAIENDNIKSVLQRDMKLRLVLISGVPTERKRRAATHACSKVVRVQRYVFFFIKIHRFS